MTITSCLTTLRSWLPPESGPRRWPRHTSRLALNVLEYRDGSGPASVQLLWSSPSTSQAVIPTSQLYADGGWLDTDVGGTAAGGFVRSNGSAFTIQGAGSFGGTADQGHFVYQSLPS